MALRAAEKFDIGLPFFSHRCGASRAINLQGIAFFLVVLDSENKQNEKSKCENQAEVDSTKEGRNSEKDEDQKGFPGKWSRGSGTIQLVTDFISQFLIEGITRLLPVVEVGNHVDEAAPRSLVLLKDSCW
jgi:hypothetical protein